jgi:hypothetical protein
MAGKAARLRAPHVKLAGVKNQKLTVAGKWMKKNFL